MVLLNVACLGDRDDYIRGHVLSAQDSATEPGFHLDKWPATPEPGMLERPALDHLHAGSRGLAGGRDEGPLGQGGSGAVQQVRHYRGSAAVLDACCTASDDWLYDHDGRLRAECRSLAGKPLLGGSGDAKPRSRTGSGSWGSSWTCCPAWRTRTCPRTICWPC
jgi:hypothetical protein